MASKASIAGHPIHPMIIPFPFALWTVSFVTDVVYLLFVNNSSLMLISKFLLAAGSIGAVAAAIPGIIDWTAIRNAEVKRTANWHARLNIIALIIFVASFYLRTRSGAPLVNRSLTIPFILSLIGIILISISGWLGGDLAYKHGVGVAPQNDSAEEAADKVRYE